jgi:hypothetical protein
MEAFSCVVGLTCIDEPVLGIRLERFEELKPSRPLGRTSEQGSCEQ